MSQFVFPKGANFRLSEAIPLEDLSKALCRVAEFLQDNGYIDKRFMRYEDWGEHDGLHFEKGSMDLQGLFGIVKSPRAIYEAMPGDENVRVGIAPDTGDWYLRFHTTWSDEGRFLVGHFDITLPESLASQFREEIVRSFGLRMEEEPAESYYRRITA